MRQDPGTMRGTDSVAGGHYIFGVKTWLRNMSVHFFGGTKRTRDDNKQTSGVNVLQKD